MDEWMTQERTEKVRAAERRPTQGHSGRSDRTHENAVSKKPRWHSLAVEEREKPVIAAPRVALRVRRYAILERVGLAAVLAASAAVGIAPLPPARAAEAILVPAPAPGADHPATLNVTQSRRAAQPVYPAEAVKKGLTGTVLVKARIESDGHVSEVTVAHSSGLKAFDDSALAAVRHWVFGAEVRNGKPTPSYMLVPIDFAPPQKPRAR